MGGTMAWDVVQMMGAHSKPGEMRPCGIMVMVGHRARRLTGKDFISLDGIRSCWSLRVSMDASVVTRPRLVYRRHLRSRG